MSDEAIQKALNVAEEVFRHFMSEVVNKKVVAVRVKPLDAKEQKDVDSGKRINDQPIRLLSISGKGGSAYPEYENVTLLDHLLSVTRGAVLLAVIDDVTMLEDEDIPILKRQLALTVAIAFLHDLDKDCQLKRDTELTPEMAGAKLEQYGINEWLSNYQLSLTPMQILHLIERVEDKQQFRHLSDVPLPREAVWAEKYVGVADKLDGAWLHKDQGITEVLNRLQKKDTRIKNPLTKAWRMPAIDILDPHHPFLLDELQRCISWECSGHIGIPPLIEIHKDGRLFMVLPERGKKTDETIEKAFERFAGRLPAGLRLEIDAKGSKAVPKLIDGQPDYDGLLTFLWKLYDEERVKIFYVKKEAEEIIENNLGELLDDMGLPFKWSGEKYRLPFSDLKGVDDPEIKERFINAAIAALLLNLPDKPDTRKKRGEEFNSILKEARPQWLDTIKNAQSQHTITALWAALNYEKDDSEFTAIWGEDEKQNGLLRLWWEGDSKRKGLRRDIENKGGERIQAAMNHYRSLLSGRRVVADNEDAEGRCIFTDCPVPSEQVIRSQHKLDAVNISAFTGRDGHEEDLTLSKGRVHVGQVSFAEYQLRRDARNFSGISIKGKDEPPAPTLISSPTTSGLFGGFAIDKRQNFQDVSASDLATADISKGALSFDLNHYMGRVRIARFEKIAEKAKEQIHQLHDLLKASLRMGRPIHIFRGLPVPKRAFFYFDAMPKYLAELIGGNELCLDQIPNALERIKAAENILNTNKLGFDILRAFVSEKGRFGALCLAWCRLSDDNKYYETRTFLMECIVKEFKEGKMSDRDKAFIRFAEAASSIQKGFGEGASHEVQLTVFDITFEAVEHALKYGQTDRQSLIYAIAGKLEENLPRKTKTGPAAAEWREGKKLLRGCIEAAERFTDEVWFGALKGHIPPQSAMSTLKGIYRVALLETYRLRKDGETNENTDENSGE